MKRILGIVGIILLAYPGFGRTPVGDNILPGSIHGSELFASKNVINNANSQRINENLFPIHYQIKLRPIFELLADSDTTPWTIVGTVQIRLECRVATNQIVLHAFDLTKITVSSVTVESLTTEPEIRVTSIDENQLDGQARVFHLNRQLFPNRQYVITISNYEAKFADNKGEDGRTHGLYRTTYKDENGAIKTVAVSHFSRTRGFRKLVPSFDDPKFKATFEIWLGRHNSYKTLCNMEIQPRGTVPIDGIPNWEWDKYEPTPVMPPTVLAMIVHQDLAASTALETAGFPKPVKVWGPPQTIRDGHANVSSKAVADLLEFFDTYFDIPYELNKMDSVGVNHFGAGAMENWGLNIYRSSLMFLHPETATAAQEFSTINVISHELAHQWWGNLVTHQWWNDWWLTEGFATYYSYVMFHHVYPRYGADIRAVTDELQTAMAFDITSGSTPIHGEYEETFANNPSAIDYDKGSALVRMLNGFLTEEVFLCAVKFYLSKRRYTAVRQDDLFADLQESLEDCNGRTNGVTISAIMERWTKTTGFPLVRVSVSSATSNTVYFSQERFKEWRDEGRPDDDQTWYVPITYASRANTNFQDDRLPDLWLNQDVRMVNHKVSDSRDWLVVNPDSRAYYRVLYDDHFAGLLQTQLAKDFSTISEISRSQLIDDYLSSAFELYIRFDEAEKMLNFLSNDGRLGPWISFLRHFRKGYNLLRQSEAPEDVEWNRLKAYILPKVQGGLTKINVAPQPNDEIQTNILRSQLLDWACSMEDATAIAFADRQFANWVRTSTNSIEAELRSVVYCRAAFNDPRGTNWEFMRSQYALTNEVALRSALKCSVNQTNLDALLVSAQDESLAEEAWAQLAVLAGSTVESRGDVIRLLTTNLEDLVEKFEIEGIADVFSAMSPLVSDDDEIQRIVDITTAAVNQPLFTSDVESRMSSSIATMRANGGWLRKFVERFVDKFQV